MISKLKSVLGEDVFSVFSGATFTFIFRIFGALLNFALVIYLGRTIGAEGLGAFNFTITVLVACSTLSLLGLNNLITKEVPRLRVKAKAKIKAFFQSVFYIVLFSSVLLGVLLITGGFLSNLIGGPYVITISFTYGGIGLTFYAILLLISDYIRAMGAPRISGFVQFTAVPLILIFIVFLINQTLKIESVLRMYLIILLAVSIISLIYSFKVTPKGKFDYKKRKLIKLARPFYWIKVVNLPLTYIDTVILGFMVTAFDFGLYTTVMKVIMLMKFVSQAFTFVAAPKISEILASGKQKELGSFNKKITLGIICIMGPIIFYCVFFAEAVLLLFGEAFTVATSTLIVLSIGNFISMATGIAGPMLTYTGNQNKVLYVNLFAGILNLLMCLILVPLIGILGAAFASAISFAIANIILMWQVYRKFGFFTLPFRISFLEAH